MKKKLLAYIMTACMLTSLLPMTAVAAEGDPLESAGGVVTTEGFVDDDITEEPKDDPVAEEPKEDLVVEEPKDDPVVEEPKEDTVEVEDYTEYFELPTMILGEPQMSMFAMDDWTAYVYGGVTFTGAKPTAEKWIDRVSIPEFADDFYDILVEATDGDGRDDYLMDGTYFEADEAVSDGTWNVITTENGAMTGLEVKLTLAPNEVFKKDADGEFVVEDNHYVFNGNEASVASAAYQHMYAAYNAFDKDYPEVYWLSNVYSHVASWGYSVEDGTGEIQCEMSVYMLLAEYEDGEKVFDKRLPQFVGTMGELYVNKEYLGTANHLTDKADIVDLPVTLAQDIIDDFDADMAAEFNAHLTAANLSDAGVAAAAFDDLTNAGKVAYFSYWLAEHNDYNTDLDMETPGNPILDARTARDCISALIGKSGSDGPVCEGYARAMSVLCKKAGVPCVLVEGTLNGGPHLWNMVKLEDGTWYATDATNADNGENSYRANLLLFGKEWMGENGWDFVDEHSHGPAVSAADFTFPAGWAAKENTDITEDKTWDEATTLSDDLTVADGAKLTLNAPVTIAGNVTISGGGEIVRGDTYKGSLFIVPEDVSLTLEDITVDGGADWTGENYSVLGRGIENEGLAAKDALIRVQGGTLNLNDGAKVQNNENAAERTNLYFHNATLARYYMMGGGIAVYGGKVVMNAGAVVKDNAVRNTLPEGYGTYAEGITEGNSDSVGGGIGIYENGTFIMNGGTITGNHATNGNNVITTNSRGMGGGVGALSRVGESQQNSIKIDIKGGSIEHNASLNFGAGIYTSVDQGDSALRLDCMDLNVAGTISANAVDGNNTNDGAGGGICSNYTKVTISKGAVISDNTAYNSGGGIRLGSSSVLTMDAGTISGNRVLKTDGWGGGIYLNAGGIKSPHMINGGTITGNSAASGGGIASSKDPVEIKDVEITNNTAANGGGMNMANANVDLKNVVITGNKATVTGGGIVGNGGTTTISNATIENNTANTDGGGIYANNTLKMLEGGSVANNTAVNGGGLYLSDIKEGSEVNGWTIKGNMATSESATHVYGGGLYITGQTAPFAIKNCEITENAAKDATTASNGGALYLNGGTSVMENNNIHNNTAQSNGGVMFVNNAKVYMDGDRLTGNKATNGNGGAIYIASSGTPLLSVKNAVNITGNTAKDAANNVYLNNKHITLTGALTAGAAVGVTTATVPIASAPVQITAAETETDYYAASAQYFIADAKPATGSYIAEANNTGKYVQLAYSNTKYYNVTLDLTNLTVESGSLVTQVEENAKYTVKLVPAAGYKLPENVGDGTVTIEKVLGDTTITAAAEPITYKVAFDANGGKGEAISAIDMTYDKETVLPANTYTLEGYTFAGWSTTEAGAVVYADQESVKNLTTEDDTTVTLYAVWTQKAVIPRFDDAVQSFRYDGGVKAYTITSELENFEIYYQQDDKKVEEPKNVGTYDVVIYRVEDGTYAEFTQIIKGGLVITAADYPVSITADPAESRGAVTVTLTPFSTAAGIVVTGVTCSDDTITVTDNGNGTYSASLPNVTKTYTFTAEVSGDELGNYGEGPATCIVNVTRRSSGGSSSSSSTPAKNDVSAENPANGSIELNTDEAKKGDTVTFTVKPEEGYEVGEVTVTDENGKEIKVKDNGDGTYSFTMPASEVEIEVEFKEITEETKPAEEGVAQESISLTIGSVVAMVDGMPVVNDVAPIIKEDRTMLPIRFIAEALGATVEWDDDADKVTITKGDIVIEIYIGQPFALVNGEPVQLDAPAFIENDRTYLPLRFVAEALGATVLWDANTNTVTIIPNK